MFKKRWFQTLTLFIMVFLLILLISVTDFIFDPIFKYIGAVAIPIVGAGVLFYLTKPIVRLLDKYKVHRVFSIIIVFLLISLVIYLIATYIAPIAQKQFANLIENIPKMVEGAQDLITYWQSNQDMLPKNFEDTLNDITSNLQSYIEVAMSFLFGFIGQLIGFVFALVLVPFFLFFMLKDGEKFVPFVTQIFSEKKAKNLKSLLHKIDETLTSYIQGQLLVSFAIGVLLFIGYLIIDLHYALTLALFGMLMCVIPFIGPFIAVVPAVIVGFFQDPMMAVWVGVVMVVAQQIEGNLISPNVMGRALALHPLTIITIILAAGSIAGFLGILFAVPFYAIVKTIIVHFYQTYVRSQEDEEDALI
ncbi:AI-2E family transporter [Virgibacillus phasianinus]|uniref:AI-2E family transporter n=1 Tax=Virgibacillus phasianinus TaxID=2017483 RepID=A0A220U862_9BACI|nr:AI-2E family transporter [Virgibacillus phasianinus]ASK64318.1 AI-2E family transporter [Virgibacillus phasianinus]